MLTAWRFIVTSRTRGLRASVGKLSIESILAFTSSRTSRTSNYSAPSSSGCPLSSRMKKFTPDVKKFPSETDIRFSEMAAG